MAMSVTLQLTEPITAHGKEIAELTLREPLTKDYREIGSPYLLLPGDNEQFAVDIRTSVVAKYIVRLGGIPLSSVDQLCMNDFNACIKAIMGFFGEGDGMTESNDSQNEPST